MSNDDPIAVRCASSECRAPYTTSLLNFTTQRNKCLACGSSKAQRLDTKTTDEPPPYQESAS